MIDLHLHLDGSLTASEICFLAEQQKIELPANTPEALQPYLTASDCRDLTDYLKCFDIPLSVLQTPAAVEYAVTALLYRLRHMMYAEIHFAPQLHTKRGMSQGEAVAAAIRSLRNAEQIKRADLMGSGLILCLMRGADNWDANIETVAVAERYLGKGVCAVDLAGAEALYPTADYVNIFSELDKRGVPFTIHAGEAAGPDSIWAALSCGAKRIGHGVRCVEDPMLMEELARRKTVLELCPSSNVQTKAVKSIEEFPIKEILACGIPATINTDNMTVSSTTINRELDLLRRSCGLTRDEERRLMLNAAAASFQPGEEKRYLELRFNRRWMHGWRE